MSAVLTVRIEPTLLTKADARAACLGLNRARYVRDLIQRDLEIQEASPKRKFASEDLVGAYRYGGGSATNQSVRQNLRDRVAARREAKR